MARIECDIGDHGRIIHTTVSRALLPGGTPVPASINSDGVKMGFPEGWSWQFAGNRRSRSRLPGRAHFEPEALSRIASSDLVS